MDSIIPRSLVYKELYNYGTVAKDAHSSKWKDSALEYSVGEQYITLRYGRRVYKISV